MENRKQAILRAVVHEFTTSAVPVGSQALQSRYFVNLSSATIRSELAELADLGYLTQPHTSAGRIPTDSGYRYFVDFLMDLEEVPERVRGFINEELGRTTADIQRLLERAARTAAPSPRSTSTRRAPRTLSSTTASATCSGSQSSLSRRGCSRSWRCSRRRATSPFCCVSSLETPTCRSSSDQRTRRASCRDARSSSRPMARRITSKECSA